MDPLFLPALLALLIGLACCFWGYTFFRILMPLWGFLVGFSLATTWGGSVPGDHTGMLSWVIALIVGIICMLLAYSFYYGAVILMCSSVGFWIGWGYMISQGDHGTLSLLVGLAAASAVAIIMVMLDAPRTLIILLSALGGASAVIAALLIFLELIPTDQMQYGATGAMLNSSWLWGLAWVVLALMGIIAQWLHLVREQYDRIETDRLASVGNKNR